MPKQRTIFVCQQCGYESLQWLGRCPNCQTWNSMAETVVEEKKKLAKRGERGEKGKPLRLSEVKSETGKRISTGISEFDRVLGGPSVDSGQGPSTSLPRAKSRGSGQGGIVPGSVILLAGDPGIGKSTLLLQVAAQVVGHSSSVLYVSGEESPQQIKIRADRLGIKSDNLLFLNETDVDAVISQISQIGPISLIIIDSIQTLWTSDLTGTAGSVGQVRECANKLLNIAKNHGIPIFLVGHVTKEGAIAGPMVLAHLVDTVLYLEGERYQSLRLLRGVKNRFGPTEEIGVFKMEEEGLRQVKNPSELFLGEESQGKPGSVVVCVMEGTRPILCEIQALVLATNLPVPRRVVSGLDFNRLQLLVAILQKKLNLPLYTSDIFVNVAGGLKILEPAADLGICLSIISSFKEKKVLEKTAVFGEVGLLGEIRNVGQAWKREKEARKLGFKNLVTPENYHSLLEVLTILR